MKPCSEFSIMKGCAAPIFSPFPEIPGQTEGCSISWISADVAAIWECVQGIRIHDLIIELSLSNRYKLMALETGHLTLALLRQELKKMGTLNERIFITHCKPQFRTKIKEEIGKLGLNNIEILKDGQLIKL